jgi:hypothetical protein
VHYHFVRERVLSGEVELEYVPTDRQTADIFTKPLGLDKLRKFSGALGLRHLDMPNLRGREELEPNELEIANSDSESRSEKAESDRRFDSDTLNQLRPKQTRRTQRKRQRRDSKEAEKGRVSEQSRPEGSRKCDSAGIPERRIVGIPTRLETSENRPSRKSDPSGRCPGTSTSGRRERGRSTAPTRKTTEPDELTQPRRVGDRCEIGYRIGCPVNEPKTASRNRKRPRQRG